MIPIKSQSEIKAMRETCSIAATVLDRMCKKVAPGVNTYDLDQFGREVIESFGAQSACYLYQAGMNTFPAHTCLSINDEVVHGIGALNRVLEEGDIITVDVCVNDNGFVGDNARTIAVGSCDPKVQSLLDATEKSLY